MTGLLTVSENIFFSATLRLPASLTIKERSHEVDRVIKELQLQKCADRKVILLIVIIIRLS